MDETLEIFRRKDKKWSWRLRAKNGKIIATDGNQGYENHSDAHDIAISIVDGSFGESVVMTMSDPDA